MISSSISSPQTVDPLKKAYYTGIYPSDHWALQPYTFADSKVIALADYKDSQYALYLNPTDKRGYGCIVRFIKNENMLSTINRDYTPQERIGLGLMMQLVADVYNRILPLSQTAVLGNNSHGFDAHTHTTFLGISEEPSFLHGHIFGRGDPESCYIEDVKLDGPLPGLNFDMMAKTAHETGNSAKVKWKNGEIEKAVGKLKEEIEKLKKEYTDTGLSVMTQPYCEIYLIRHGETDWNTQGKLQGHTDIPLNMHGEEQALSLKKKFENLHFSAVFSSDLSRAVKTAALILESTSLEIHETPSLRERYMGAWEGRLTAELKEWLEKQSLSSTPLSQEKYLASKWQNDIESYAEVYQRVTDFIHSHALSHLGSSLLLSSHGGVLRALLYALDFHAAQRWQVSNCAYIKLRMTHTGALLLLKHEGITLVEKDAVPF